ncbi:MAG: DUF2147 domain-containing protein [Sphingobium sp.]|uniref:DUF2147 domain-containing protein n=1 Tax=Sphingobium sp. TaxID=1912891 RepID=UPI0029BC326F|nr:DUF2147 domain-containing protein [Sphingobium sp.]MDX3909160.1 DUF2147 domain-containing protein [Sphingobium sp.]
MVPSPASAAQPISGRWLTENGKAIVQIGPCGGAMCGQIAKVVKPTPGAPRNYAHNPDEKLRNRPIEGLTILSDFNDAGSLWKGQIYDPQSGKTYASKLARNANGTLKVQGCIAFFCKTQIWTPAR